MTPICNDNHNTKLNCIFFIFKCDSLHMELKEVGAGTFF